MRAKFASARFQDNNVAHILRRSTILTLGLFLAVGVLMGGHLSAASAAPASPTVNQCNGTDNAGGQAVVCDITITNNLNMATGAVSSTVTTNDCHGAAGAPPVITCIPLTQNFPTLTTAADQCNGSGLGGGSNVICSVTILNNITGTVTRWTSASDRAPAAAGLRPWSAIPSRRTPRTPLSPSATDPATAAAASSACSAPSVRPRSPPFSPSRSTSATARATAAGTLSPARCRSGTRSWPVRPRQPDCPSSPASIRLPTECGAPAEFLAGCRSSVATLRLPQG
jgi:hypothetical protein